MWLESQYIHFFIVGPFTTACLKYTALNVEMIDEWRIGKNLEGSACGLIEVLYQNFLWSAGLYHWKFYQDSRCLCQDSKLAPPEYDATQSRSDMYEYLLDLILNASVELWFNREVWDVSTDNGIVFHFIRPIFWNKTFLGYIILWKATLRKKSLVYSKIYPIWRVGLPSACMIWGSHSGSYDEFHLLGHNAVWSHEQQCLLLPSSSFLSRLIFRI
jgi:hypothetical protein